MTDLTPQAILKARFGELAESLDLDLVVRRQGDKFYFTVTGQFPKIEAFMRQAMPGAWMTSAAGSEVSTEAIYGLPAAEVSRVLMASQINQAWLQHNAGVALRIAQQVRDGRAFDHLPVLGDALEEGGCDQAEILRHCRASAPHRQTCWVVDLLLGPPRKSRRPRPG